MLNLDRTFTGPKHKPMLPAQSSEEYTRAEKLFRLERTLFSSWCSLVFRQPSRAAIQSFEADLDQVNAELLVTSSPWFLNDFSIVDLTYITHLERMFASVAYWSGIRIRGSGRWKAIERWVDAFEAMPSYMATKSDYYTHIQDIPPQYGPGYSVNSAERTRLAGAIDGSDGSWKLPLSPFNVRYIHTFYSFV
jgi:glutathione S-transferase